MKLRNKPARNIMSFDRQLWVVFINKSRCANIQSTNSGGLLLTPFLISIYLVDFVWPTPRNLTVS